MDRKALLVGINDYKGVSDLRGCVNDVLDMHFLFAASLIFRLVRFVFLQITVLPKLI